VQELSHVKNNGDPIFNRQNQKLLVVVVILLIPCSYITIARNADWKDTVTLFSKDIVKAPESALLNYNYANELKAELAARETDIRKKNAILEKAVVHYQKALEIYSGYDEVLEQLGLAYYYLGNDSDAFNFISKAIEADPLRSTAYNSLGTWYFEKAKNYEKALELYLYAVQLNPNYIDGWRNTGAAYGTLGQLEKALDAFKRVLLLDPQNVTVLNFMSQTYKSLGDQNNADVYAEKARAAANEIQ
jgi:tetratricopeptide (TPR) repeat protein